MMIFRVKEIYYDLKLHRNIPMYLNTKIVEIERNIQQMAKVSDLFIPLLIYTYTYTYLLPLSLLYPSSLLTCLPFYLDFFLLIYAFIYHYLGRQGGFVSSSLLQNSRRYFQRRLYVYPVPWLLPGRGLMHKCRIFAYKAGRKTKYLKI